MVKTLVITQSGKENTGLVTPVPEEKLWSPDNPFLYDLTISLKKGNSTIGAVFSYFECGRFQF